MANENLKGIFGTKAEDKNLEAKGGVNFGLHTNATIEQFEFEQGQFGPQMIFKVKLKSGSETMTWIPLQPHQEAKDQEAEMMNIVATLKHILKSVGCTDEQFDKATEQVSSYSQGIKALIALLPKDFNTKPVDVFIEWQQKASEKAGRKFTTLPKNMKGGQFIVPHVEPVGQWTEKRVEGEYIKFVDDANNEHPISKSASFMMSFRAKEIDENAEKPVGGSSPASSKEAATEDTW